jgi:Zinc-binding dehydrogenase
MSRSPGLDRRQRKMTPNWSTRFGAFSHKAKPAKVFDLKDIRDAHRFMESSSANGKIVVRV